MSRRISFDSYNYNSKKVNCSCQVKDNSLIKFSDIVINKTKLYEKFIDIKSTANIDILICYKKLFNIKSIFQNAGSIIIIVIIIFHSISFFIFYFNQLRTIQTKIKEIVNIVKIKANIENNLITNNNINSQNNNKNKILTSSHNKLNGGVKKSKNKNNILNKKNKKKKHDNLNHSKKGKETILKNIKSNKDFKNKTLKNSKKKEQINLDTQKNIILLIDEEINDLPYEQQFKQIKDLFVNIIYHY